MNINTNNEIDNRLVMSKYSTYISRTRNIFTSSSLGLAVLGFSNSTLFERDDYRPLIKIIGVIILLIANLYGWEATYDMEQYLNKKIINEKTNLINSLSVSRDILFIRAFLCLMIIVILITLFSLFN